MFIFKNALRCISRSKGRNLLIGIITLVISVSACLGLSIKQAAESARADALENMTITATISYDRQGMMGAMAKPDGNSQNGDRKEFDKDKFFSEMNNFSSLTLEEYQTYAKAESVKDFYYTLTASLDGNDSFSPVSTQEENQESSMGFFPGMGEGRGPMGMGNAFSSNGDFTLIGYSSDNAMTDFINGNATISEGAVFDEGTTAYSCIISRELADFNTLSVGDKIKLYNPENETEYYKLKIVGIYTGSGTNDTSFSAFSTSQDPANKIYMSAAALSAITDKSTSASDNDGNTAVKASINATYVFADADAYNSFEKQVRDLGLDDSYTVSSADLMAFESSLTPLNTLSTLAGWFLTVILIIGAIILVVLNIFNVRERKYEVGVLTAMGMKKSRVSLQFVAEILLITMISVIFGASIGAVSSVPVTNALLSSQTESKLTQQTQIENSFGRGPGGMQGNLPPEMSEGRPELPGFMGNAAEYITRVDSAMNLTVVLQMILIGLFLTLIASAFSVLFVMRYDPLKILSNRD